MFSWFTAWLSTSFLSYSWVIFPRVFNSSVSTHLVLLMLLWAFLNNVFRELAFDSPGFIHSVWLFVEPPNCFSKMAALVLPPHQHWESPFLHILTSACGLPAAIPVRRNQYATMALLHCANDSWCWELFQVSIGHLYLFLVKYWSWVSCVVLNYFLMLNFKSYVYFCKCGGTYL